MVHNPVCRLLLKILWGAFVLGSIFLQFLLCALRLLVVIVVVAACQSLGGDVESSVSVSPPTRAHTPLKQKKIAPVISVVVVTRRSLHMVSEPVRPATWDSLRLR